MSNNIETLRATLFDTLNKLKAKQIEPDAARQINEVAKTIVDTAKVEVDYLRVTGQTGSTFLSLPAAPAPSGETSGITGITRHVLQG